MITILSENTPEKPPFDYPRMVLNDDLLAPDAWRLRCSFLISTPRIFNGNSAFFVPAALPCAAALDSLAGSQGLSVVLL